MKYAYLLESVSEPDQIYTGSTDDLRNRLAEHNAGKSVHTRKHTPWRRVTCLAFSDPQKAAAFERYLNG
jgi:putative endonuclease